MLVPDKKRTKTVCHIISYCHIKYYTLDSQIFYTIVSVKYNIIYRIVLSYQ